jgi:hypothetical protein
MSTETLPATNRAAQIAAIHDFADWLAINTAVPVPMLNLHRHLMEGDGTEAENLDAVRSLAASLDVGTDEDLDDRTVLRVKVNEHVWYGLFAWHKNGRNIGELEKLRAEVAALRAAQSGMAYTRADTEDDPTPVSPGRVPLRTGSVVDGDQLVVDGQ